MYSAKCLILNFWEILNFFLNFFRENRMVKSISLLLRKIKATNLMQNYSHIIAYICRVKLIPPEKSYFQKTQSY